MISDPKMMKTKMFFLSKKKFKYSLYYLIVILTKFFSQHSWCEVHLMITGRTRRLKRKDKHLMFVV